MFLRKVQALIFITMTLNHHCTVGNWILELAILSWPTYWVRSQPKNQWRGMSLCQNQSGQHTKARKSVRLRIQQNKPLWIWHNFRGKGLIHTLLFCRIFWMKNTLADYEYHNKSGNSCRISYPDEHISWIFCISFKIF